MLEGRDIDRVVGEIERRRYGDILTRHLKGILVVGAADLGGRNRIAGGLALYGQGAHVVVRFRRHGQRDGLILLLNDRARGHAAKLDAGCDVDQVTGARPQGLALDSGQDLCAHGFRHLDGGHGGAVNVVEATLRLDYAAVAGRGNGDAFLARVGPLERDGGVNRIETRADARGAVVKRSAFGVDHAAADGDAAAIRFVAAADARAAIAASRLDVAARDHNRVRRAEAAAADARATSDIMAFERAIAAALGVGDGAAGDLDGAAGDVRVKPEFVIFCDKNGVAAADTRGGRAAGDGPELGVLLDDDAAAAGVVAGADARSAKAASGLGDLAAGEGNGDDVASIAAADARAALSAGGLGDGAALDGDGAAFASTATADARAAGEIDLCVRTPIAGGAARYVGTLTAALGLGDGAALDGDGAACTAVVAADARAAADARGTKAALGFNAHAAGDGDLVAGAQGREDAAANASGQIAAGCFDAVAALDFKRAAAAKHAAADARALAAAYGDDGAAFDGDRATAAAVHHIFISVLYAIAAANARAAFSTLGGDGASLDGDGGDAASIAAADARAARSASGLGDGAALDDDGAALAVHTVADAGRQFAALDARKRAAGNGDVAAVIIRAAADARAGPCAEDLAELAILYFYGAAGAVVAAADARRAVFRGDAVLGARYLAALYICKRAAGEGDVAARAEVAAADARGARAAEDLAECAAGDDDGAAGAVVAAADARAAGAGVAAERAGAALYFCKRAAGEGDVAAVVLVAAADARGIRAAENLAEFAVFDFDGAAMAEVAAADARAADVGAVDERAGAALDQRKLAGLDGGAAALAGKTAADTRGAHASEDLAECAAGDNDGSANTAVAAADACATVHHIASIGVAVASVHLFNCAV